MSQISTTSLINTLTVADIVALANFVLVCCTLIWNGKKNRELQEKLEKEKINQLKYQQKNYWFKTYILDKYLEDLIISFDKSFLIMNKGFPKPTKMKEFQKENNFIKYGLFIHLKIFDKTLLKDLKKLFEEYETNFYRNRLTNNDIQKYKATFIKKLYDFNKNFLT